MAKVFRTLKLGGDIGNSRCDFVGENNYNDGFDSCLVENKGTEREDSDISLEIGEKHYSVGQGNITGGSIDDRKLEEYEALAVAGICRYVNALNIDKDKTEIEIDFCIGLPTGDYADYKKDYKELFDGKAYSVKYAGKQYDFKIRNIMVVPQGAVVAHNNKKLFEGVKTGFIIDFGSYTFDIQEISNNVLVKNSKKSYDEGVIRMLGDVGAILKKKGVTSIEPKDIEAFIINGRIRTKYQEEDKKYVTMKDEDVVEYFDNKIAAFAKKAKDHFPNLGASEKTYCIGGGAIAFGDSIRKEFNDVDIPVNANKVNAEQYYVFAGGR